MAFAAVLELAGDTATIEISGELDASTATHFHDVIDDAAGSGASHLEIKADRLSYMSSAGLRSLVFARQKMGEEVRIVITGATETVARTIRLAGFDHSIELVSA
ncbi:STAS domain-containing protein [Streptacidiphilus fuscans]|uniref:Anti-sigma factor antagonist n=1 Tax=Streptacidiphilus fuscans TaxID=2789292 RepID=A0A931FFY6_9ACTN|nr:STAS domain-containing protein [Streptacidiphilus fuscans]MBF9070760.1 STAS domain-containing protein [Streptacidiphilus fuscans]